MSIHKEMEELSKSLTKEEELSSSPKSIEKKMKLVQYYLELENKTQCKHCNEYINNDIFDIHEKICKKNKSKNVEDVECEFCKSLIKPQSLKKHQQTKKCLKFQIVLQEYKK